jgi:hypothetical protein
MKFDMEAIVWITTIVLVIIFMGFLFFLPETIGISKRKDPVEGGPSDTSEEKDLQPPIDPKS